MARQIIKQPNGKYCIFSTICDNITHYDMTPEEIVELWVEESRKTITDAVIGVIHKLEKDEQPYYQFTQSYEEMLHTIKLQHGKKEAKKIKCLIES